MAERRMFAKTIIDSDAFLDMSVSARLLYYDLAMRADDDGFVNSPKKIMKMIGASEDDIRMLVLRKFIIPFDNGVVVIKHWRIHNYIRKDTYNATQYKEQKELLEFDENNAYRLLDETDVRGRLVDDSSTQVRLGKDRLDKDIYDGKRKRFQPPSFDEVSTYNVEKKLKASTETINDFIDFYDSKNWMVGKNKMSNWKSAFNRWARSNRKDVDANDPFANVVI